MIAECHTGKMHCSYRRPRSTTIRSSRICSRGSGDSPGQFASGLFSPATFGGVCDLETVGGRKPPPQANTYDYREKTVGAVPEKSPDSSRTADLGIVDLRVEKTESQGGSVTISTLST